MNWKTAMKLKSHSQILLENREFGSRWMSVRRKRTGTIHVINKY